LLSLELTAMLHGITQAVWDLRRLVSWIRGGTDAPVGVYGVSLGAHAWQGGHVQWFNVGHVGFTWSRTALGVLAARLHDTLGAQA
jgi:hypothetical protein